jgi:hypothetical protein
MRSPFHQCNSFTFHYYNKSVAKFVERLSDRDWDKFNSVADLFTTTLLTGAPAVHRIEKVKGATNTIWELKITVPGTPGPQLRMLCSVHGRKVICLRGVDKRDSQLRLSDVRAADAAAGRCLRGERERQRKSEGGRRPRA